MRVDERYAGFPEHALGGYVAGLLARDAGALLDIEVRLERPVRLGDELVVADDALLRGGERVAVARRASVDARLPRPVGREEAERAALAYFGLAHHHYPNCFCCGPERGAGDGLRIFPGDVGGGVVAAPWRPADALDANEVPTELVWSALDCPGIWAQVLTTAGSGERVVSGTIAVTRLAPIAARATQVVLGWPIAREGRKIHVGAAIVTERGEPLAVARHTLVVTERGVPLDRERWAEAPAPSLPEP